MTLYIGMKKLIYKKSGLISLLNGVLQSLCFKKNITR